MTDSSSTGADPSGKTSDDAAGTSATSPSPETSAAGKAGPKPSVRSPLRQPTTIDLKANPSPEDKASAEDPGAKASAATGPATGAAPGRGRPGQDAIKGQDASGQARSAAGAGAPARESAAPPPGGSEPPAGPKAAAAPGPAAARPGLGFTGGLLAAVIGAAAGVAGAWVVTVVSPTGIATTQQDGALEQRYAALEQQLAAKVSDFAPKSDVAALTTRLEDITRQVTAVSDEARALSQRLEARAASPEGAPQQADGQAAQQRAAETATPDAAVTAQLSAMAEQVKALKQQALQAGAAASDVSEKVAALEGAARDAAEARRRAQALDVRIADLGRAFAARGADPRVAELARALAASDILQAIRNGRPVGKDIIALAAAGADQALASQLQGAAGGLATVESLRREFAPLADRLAALQHRDEGVLDRLTASASRLVRVRPVDQNGQPVAAPDGSIERLSDALQRGDLQTAARAWAALPEALRNESAGFGATLQARVRTEAAVRSILESALAAVARDADVTAPSPQGGAQGQGGRP